MNIENFKQAAIDRNNISLTDKQLDNLIEVTQAIIAFLEQREGEASLLFVLRLELDRYLSYKDERKAVR